MVVAVGGARPRTSKRRLDVTKDKKRLWLTAPCDHYKAYGLMLAISIFKPNDAVQQARCSSTSCWVGDHASYSKTGMLQQNDIYILCQLLNEREIGKESDAYITLSSRSKL